MELRILTNSYDFIRNHLTNFETVSKVMNQIQNHW